MAWRGTSGTDGRFDVAWTGDEGLGDGTGDGDSGTGAGDGRLGTGDWAPPFPVPSSPRSPVPRSPSLDPPFPRPRVPPSPSPLFSADVRPRGGGRMAVGIRMTRRWSRIRAFFTVPVEPFKVEEGLSVEEVLARMERISFQGRNLATAHRVWRRMLGRSRPHLSRRRRRPQRRRSAPGARLPRGRALCRLPRLDGRQSVSRPARNARAPPLRRQPACR